MLLPVPRGFAPPAAFPYSPDHTQIGVPDPWHFGVDPDPDPRIHASYYESGSGSCYFRQ
jgi:hypothetical protein